MDANASDTTQATQPAKTGGVDSGRLKSLIERIERLEEDKAVIAADIKEIYTEAKSAGYEPKIIRAVIRLRKMDKADREEMDELTTLYLGAVE